MFSLIRTIVRKANDFFILIILVLFYFFVVGITALFLLIAAKIRSKGAGESYWKNEDKKEFSMDYFKSPY